MEINRKEKIQEIFDDDSKNKTGVYSGRAKTEHEVKEVSKNRVKELRKKLGIKNAFDFVKNMKGFSDQTLQSIEKGNSGLTLDKALKIAQEYNVSLDYLFGISDYINEEEIMIELAFEHIFNIQFPLADNEEDPLLSVNFSINEYLLEYFHHKKLLEQEKDSGELSQEAFTFELEKLREKYDKVLLSPSSKQTTYNCTKID